MFLEGPRCSSLDIDHNLETKEKDNLTTELTQLAFNSQPKNSDKSPHETVQDFFLIIRRALLEGKEEFIPLQRLHYRLH